jgi:microcin C transport system substrate-binding protein
MKSARFAFATILLLASAAMAAVADTSPTATAAKPAPQSPATLPVATAPSPAALPPAAVAPVPPAAAPAVALPALVAPIPADAAGIPVPSAAEAHYKSHPEFYHLRTLADLPRDLVWQTNNTDPEFSSPNAKRGGTVRFSIPTPPPTLRRIGPNANSSFRSFIYDNYLIALTLDHPNTGNPIPGTASHWAVSADRKTVYYRLNPAVRFDTGDPVTADDYLFCFFFYTSPHVQAPWYNDYYSNEFAGITKFDDYTIAIHLPDVRPDPIYNTQLEPVSRNFFRDLGPDFVTRYQFTQFPGVGPYRVRHKDLEPNISITLERVKDWWADNLRYFRYRHNAENIVFHVVRDQTKAFQMFLLGDLDFVEIRVPKYWYALNNESVVKDGFIGKHTFYYDRPCPTWGLFLNTIKPGLDNHDVRLGIQYATDWQRVIATFFRGDYQRLNHYAEGFGKFTNSAIRARPYDPTAAIRHFAKAGFTKRGGDGILTNPDTGERLSFQLTCRDSDVRKCLPTLIDSARKAGLEFRPEALETTTFFKKTQEKKHDIALTAWNVVNKFPTFWEGFHIINAVVKNPDGTISAKPQTNNITSTRDQALSDLIDKYRAATDDAAIIRLGYEIQQRIHEDACFVPGYKVVTVRIGAWRWVKFAPEFGMKNSDDIFETGTFWLDEAARAETQNAPKNNKTFPAVSEIHDKYNPEN